MSVGLDHGPDEHVAERGERKPDRQAAERHRFQDRPKLDRATTERCRRRDRWLLGRSRRASDCPLHRSSTRRADRSADCRRKSRATAATMLPPMTQASSTAMTMCVPRKGVRAVNTPMANPSATACGVVAQAAAGDRRHSGSERLQLRRGQRWTRIRSRKLSDSRRLNSITTSKRVTPTKPDDGWALAMGTLPYLG